MGRIAIATYGIEAIQQAVLAQGIAETAGIEMNTLAQIGYQIAVNLPRSREFEYESDRVGVEIMRRAGYSPMAFVNFLEMLQDYPLPPEFLRTHPTNVNRIEAIAEQVTESDATNSQGMSTHEYEQSIFPLN